MLAGILLPGIAKMKAEECKIGMVVYHEYDGPAYRYEVIGTPDENGMVQLKELNKTYRHADSMDVKLLHLYDEEALKKKGAELQAKVNAARDAFEKAFEALREVQDFHENGISRYSLQELDLLSIKELENTVDEGGWSSSSLWC